MKLACSHPRDPTASVLRGILTCLHGSLFTETLSAEWGGACILWSRHVGWETSSCTGDRWSKSWGRRGVGLVEGRTGPGWAVPWVRRVPEPVLGMRVVPSAVADRCVRLSVRAWRSSVYPLTTKHCGEKPVRLKGQIRATDSPYFNAKCVDLLLLLICFGRTCCMWKCPGQGLNPCHSSDPSRCSDNAWSLTHCTTKMWISFWDRAKGSSSKKGKQTNKQKPMIYIWKDQLLLFLGKGKLEASPVLNAILSDS